MGRRRSSIRSLQGTGPGFFASSWTSQPGLSTVAGHRFPTMARHSFLLLALVLLSAAGPVRAVTAVEANELYRAKRYAEARTAFEQVLAAEPGNADAAYHLGDLALLRGAPQEAIEWLEKATALAPKSSEYARELGDAYGLAAEKAGLFSKLGFARKCQAAYERAVALNPEDVEARYSLFTFFRQAPSIAGGGTDKARGAWPWWSSASPITNSRRPSPRWTKSAAAIPNPRSRAINWAAPRR